MELIETITLESTTAEIEFTSIPQTFTDLLLVASTRNNANPRRDLEFSFNGVSTDLSGIGFAGDGASVGFGLQAKIGANNTVPGAETTANTFGNAQAYIPDYTKSVAKIVSIEAVGEDNKTTAIQQLVTGRWNSTDAITAIKLKPQAVSFVAGSTVSLYGITKGSDGIVTTS